MKSLLYPLIALCAILALTGCDSKSEEPIPAPENKPVTESVEREYDGGTFSTSVKAATDWRATADADWVKLSQTQGTAGQVNLGYTLLANDTEAERTARISMSEISSGKTFYTLTIKQTAKPIIVPDDENKNAPAGMELNAMALVKNIKVGWNIGNSCESGIWDGWNGNHLDIETNWGNPKISKAFVDKLKAEGFNAVRIPVRWYVHADADLNIEQSWLDRVKEIVDYAVTQDMYVILNSHHDSWFDRLPPSYNEQSIRTRFANMWRQIAEQFKDYDQHLIFAGNNEMVSLNADGSENWGTPSSSQAQVLSGLMQLFVDTVRATGGNNAWRCLLIQPWAANFDNTSATGFKWPTDKVADRLILEYHYYTWGYSTESAGSSSKYFWGRDFSKYSPWYSNGEAEVTSLFDRVKNDFIDRGIPAIMTEFGCVQHNKSSNEEQCDLSRAYYHRFVVSEAKKRGIPGFYWDNGAFNGTGENFGLIDRRTLEISARARIALDGIINGTK